jgi:hypothetical protein
MDQHPKVTLQWALRSLEQALQNLGDGRAERRVRRQFHQLLLAVERDSSRFNNEHDDPVDPMTPVSAVREDRIQQA